MVINIQFTDVESTDALKKYARDKVKSLTKFFDNIQQADIDIGRTTNHHKKGDVYYAEVNLHVPNDMIRVVKETEDLYKAIDKVKDHMKVELEKYKGKRNRVDREEIRDSKAYHNEEKEGEAEYNEEEYRANDYEEEPNNE